MSNMLSFRRTILPAVLIVAGMLLLFRSYSHSNTSATFHDPDQQDSLRQRLARAFPYVPRRELPKKIWQTWKYLPSDEQFTLGYHNAWESWSALNPDYQHEVVTDAAASQLIARLFAGVREVPLAYEALPQPVLKADFFRYLILLAEGGVYSDIDTNGLKAIEGWVPADMRPYGLIVGIEADPDREDWNDWYARRIQFCQWTIASHPGHPILVDVVASITAETLRRSAHNGLGEEDEKSVMEFTGPGIWTDAVFAYFNDAALGTAATSAASRVTWQDFVELQQRKKVRDVVVLPITSFSPDVGHMGAGSSDDPLAFVHHAFSGTWKPDEHRKAVDT